MAIVFFYSVIPEILPFGFPSEVQEGQLLQVACTVTKGDDPVTIQWFKNGEPLLSSPNFIVNAVDARLNFLILRGVSFEHTGTYACSAVNNAGRARVEADLKVQGMRTAQFLDSQYW